MPRRRYAVWDELGAEVQCAFWREKLEAANGNITHAGAILGVTKAQAMRLTRMHALNGYAAELRVKAGAKATTGRPRSKR